MITADPSTKEQEAPRGQIKGSRSIFKALLGRTGTLAINTLTGIITARALKPDGRGELSAMILGPVFLSGAFTLGLPNSLLYTLRLKNKAQNVLVSTAMLIALLLSIITAVLGFLIIPIWLAHYPPEVVRTAQWFMISTPATILLLVGRASWEANGRFGISAACLLTPPIVTLAGLLGLLATHNLTAISGAWTYVLAGVAPLIWIVVSLRSEFVLRGREMLAATKDLMSYGLRSYGIDLCGSLSQYIDQALVVGMLTPSQMGTYTVALSLSRMVNVIFTSVASVVFPKAMDLDAAGGFRLAMRAVVGSLAIAIPSAAILAVGSSLALRLLYGREYAIASGLLQILILEALISGSVSIMSQPFMAQGRPGTVTILQVVGLAATIPLIFLLAPRMGPEGACVALLISACLRMVLLRYCYGRLLHQKVPLSRQAWEEGNHLARTVVAFVRNKFMASPAETV